MVSHIICITFVTTVVYGGTYLNLQTCFQTDWTPDGIEERVFGWVHYVNTHPWLRRLAITLAPLYAAVFIIEGAIVLTAMILVLLGLLAKFIANTPEPEVLSSMISRELSERRERNCQQ